MIERGHFRGCALLPGLLLAVLLAGCERRTPTPDVPRNPPTPTTSAVPTGR